MLIDNIENMEYCVTLHYVHEFPSKYISNNQNIIDIPLDIEYGEII